MKKISAFVALVVTTALFLAPLLSAQSIWVDFNNQTTLALEILKPNFESEISEFIKPTFLTSALFATVHIPTSENLSIVGELLLAHFGSDVGETSETNLGNLYLGLEFRFQNAPMFAEVGIRVPLVDAEDEASFAGVSSDFADRLEAFIEDAIPVTTFLNFRHKSPQGFVMRLRGGPSVLIATGDREESELGINYSAQAWYEGKQVRVGGGLTGRVIISEDGDFGERSVHQFGVNADVLLSQVRPRPGVYFRLPLDDDWNDFVNFVFGLKFDVRLK